MKRPLRLLFIGVFGVTFRSLEVVSRSPGPPQLGKSAASGTSLWSSGAAFVVGSAVSSRLAFGLAAAGLGIIDVASEVYSISCLVALRLRVMVLDFGGVINLTRTRPLAT